MDPKDLGDVRTERGDLVPEKWAPTYESCSHPDISLMKCVPMTHWAKTLGDCITELASWQARAEAADKLATHLDQLQSDYAQKYCAETASRLQWQARAEQAESTIAAWKKDAEDKDVLIGELGRPQWIRVEDRLPEYGEYVLGIGGLPLRLPYVMRMLRSEDGPVFWFGLAERSPTHWMPLPPLPGAVHETKDGVASRSTDLEREDGK